ncbi:MAG: Fe-S protein assembly co-chaperone HscB [Nitrospiria bacterium]
MSAELKTDAKKSLKKYLCWRCKLERADLYFCASCNALQAIPEDIDYFRCLGLEIRLQIHPEKLEETFYDLSRKFHPDFYQRKSPEEQQISLENTAILNKAYRTLKDPLERVAYLIGLIEGEDDIPLEAPSDLFEEIFALQEGLEEAKALPPGEGASKNALFTHLKNALERLRVRQKGARQQIEMLCAQWDSLEASDKVQSSTAEQKTCLGDMKKILSHQAYLDRMVKNIRITIEGK